MAGYRVWGLALGVVAVFAVASAADARTPLDASPRTIKVLRVSGAGLDAQTLQALTDTVLAKLARYPSLSVLPVPEADPMDLMVDAGCIDFDAECLAGLAAGADLVLYTEVAGKDGSYVVQLRLVDAKTRDLQAPEGSLQDKARLGEFVVTALDRVLGPEPVKEPEDVRVDLTTTPPGGEVYVDGDFVGVAPVTARLKPGTYKLRIAKVGFSEQRQNLVVEPGKSSQVNVALAAVEIPVVPETAPPVPEKGGESEVRKPVYKTWWFWTIIGVAVVGAGTTAALLTMDGGGGNGSAGFSPDGYMAPQDVTLYPR
ncbi:MAG TPA: PEGA domain-containing protein [Myxococcota bacterium]|jgi:hypothetical protein|nr:PEGA domain-containing protein [Myxococcota bacterium]